jgi:hypothetical protein
LKFVAGVLGMRLLPRLGRLNDLAEVIIGAIGDNQGGRFVFKASTRNGVNTVRQSVLIQDSDGTQQVQGPHCVAVREVRPIVSGISKRKGNRIVTTS